jgi:crotonobetainyl-CoA:carnitine CoA-transferase CaiB-like acyl-CoA transferase
MISQGALNGTTVIDLSRLLPGPYCSMILADHGARVLAVEERRFCNALFIRPLYRNKAHLCLNLKSAQGLEIFFRLVEGADVVLEGFRPGVVKQLGVDYERVARINPRIVYCSISGYGQTGSHRDRAGHDVNYLAQSGVLDLIGQAGGPPVIPGVQIADLLGGGLNAALGILLALLERGRTGKGQYIDIAMTDGSFSLLPLASFLQETSGKPFRRGEHLLSHRYACYSIYATKDGRYMAVGALESKFWSNLCVFLGCPDYVPLQFSEDRQEEIKRFFQETFLEKTQVEWVEALQAVDACCEPVKSMDEAFASRLFQERDMTVPDAAWGAFPAIGVPVKLDRTPGSLRTPPPQFGADTRKVLEELGYSEADIKAFFEQGIC